MHLDQKVHIGFAGHLPLFDNGIRAVLVSQPGFLIGFEWGDMASLASQLPAHSQPLDVLVAALPGTSGNMKHNDEWLPLRTLHNDHPGMHIVVLGHCTDEAFIARLLSWGINAYLPANGSPEDVFLAVKTLLETGTYTNGFMRNAIKHQVPQARPGLKQPGLTGRERELLMLICSELSFSEIAGRLFISEQAVKGLHGQLLEKTGARNTAGLVLYAVRHGILDISG